MAGVGTLTFHSGEQVKVTNVELVWPSWVIETTASTSTNIWSNWAINSTTNITFELQPEWVYQRYAPVPAYVPPVLTPEQVAAQEAENARRMAEYRAQEEARLREREEANARAEALLLDHLDENQRAEYIAGQRFHVRTAKGKIYRIYRGGVAGIEMKDGVAMEVESHCIHAREFIPEADNMLAKKLLLETDEPSFRKISNISRFPPRPTRIPVPAAA